MKKLDNLKVGKVIKNVNLEKYTSYKLKGNISTLVIPDNLDELITLLDYIKKNNLKYKIIGWGSNLIFKDNYDGILIKLDKFDNLEIKGDKVIVGSGYPTVKLALRTAKEGLTGLEFASGIPGTIGGAVHNNSGAYKSDMGYIVESIKVITPDLQIKTMYNKELDFHYRTSFLSKSSDYICIEATLVLKKGSREAIMSVIEDRKQRRLIDQPLEYPTAGSVFRNPINNFAGKLIEDMGYKGYSVGGAKVSEKHANFIINNGNATGSDIIKLINEIKVKVKETYDIDLSLEQEIVE